MQNCSFRKCKQFRERESYSLGFADDCGDGGGGFGEDGGGVHSFQANVG